VHRLRKDSYAANQLKKYHERPVVTKTNSIG
jgi:hypothetical protein